MQTIAALRYAEKIAETVKALATALIVLAMFLIYVLLLVLLVIVKCAVFALKFVIVSAWCISILLCLVSVWRIYSAVGDGIAATLAALALTLPVILLPERERSYGGLIIASIFGGAMYIIAEQITQHEILKTIMAYALPVAAVVMLFVKFYDRGERNE